MLLALHTSIFFSLIVQDINYTYQIGKILITQMFSVVFSNIHPYMCSYCTIPKTRECLNQSYYPKTLVIHIINAFKRLLQHHV